MGEPTDRYAGVPSFGATVPRRALLGMFERIRPESIAILAPPGYGKSILAFQLAALPCFDALLWVAFDGRSIDAPEAMRVIARASGSASGALGGADLASSSRGEQRDSAQVRLRAFRGQRLCLVLDNLALADPEGFETIVGLVQVTCHPESAIVVTSRDSELPLAWLGRPWTIDAIELRMSEEEARAVAEQTNGHHLSTEQVRGLLDASGGQPALLCVFTRHPALLELQRDLVSPLPADLRQELATLALGHLTKSQSLLLYTASLLGEGDTSDLDAVLDEGDSCAPILSAVADVVPLVRLSRTSGLTLTFRIHDAARSVFTSRAFRESLGEVERSALKGVVAHLGAQGEYARLFALLIENGTDGDLASCLERFGECLLREGNASLLSAALQRIPIRLLVARPRVLLVQAALMRERGRVSEAVSAATTARELAFHSGEKRVVIDALLLLSLLHLDVGNLDVAAAYCGELVGQYGHDMTLAECATVHAHLAAVSCMILRLDEARQSLQKAESVARSGDIPAEAKSRILAVTATARALGLGETRQVAESLSWIVNSAETPVTTRLTALHNSAVSLLEAGRVARAGTVLNRCLELSRAGGFDHTHSCSWSALADLAATQGHYEEADGWSTRALDQSVLIGDLAGACQELTHRAIVRRAHGDIAASLDDAEEALTVLAGMAAPAFADLASAEAAASRLALGDAQSAGEIARGFLETEVSRGAPYHALRFALVLSEERRRAGDVRAGVDLLAQHADYILSENANWVCAMYIRAFPGLLGILAAAVGVERLPLHMLRMLLSENTAVALPMAKEILSEDDWRLLASRTVGEEGLAPLSDGPELVPHCRVRLFGGLNVDTSDGPVADAAWKKRKARLLFAMLVTRKGKDVPREQLLEYLWPDMDDERARANFYVVWNNMKRALSPNLPKGEPCPYVRAAGGVCRVDDVLVTTDIDEFEQCLLDARRADTTGDRDAKLLAYERVAELYGGDLLPGDIYDDWFSQLRERCRQEFGDAMLDAASMREQDGDIASALRLVRAALAHDAWREDLYQAALRYQIVAGQRSAAIETYMNCMHKLSEDLGLDPSVETRRLYDQVLAMEDEGSERADSA
jgi:DNA-binding SARP family transcriptional activator/ATP/maltotriose-dependent transcriptional regulator MalT